MGIENIPETVLIDRGKLVNTVDTSFEYVGKFLILECEGKKFLVSSNSSNANFHMGVYIDFVEIKEKMNIEQYFERISQAQGGGGGTLGIGKDRIKASEKSNEFGKYNESTVRPILERFRDKFLPGYEIQLE